MKTKTIIVFFLIVICLNAHAYDFSAVAPTGQTLYYNISGSNVTVTKPGSIIAWQGFTQPTGYLTIPSSVSYNGVTYTVTSIGYGAFNDCQNLTTVNMPNTITSIGNYAFEQCIGLTSIQFPNSLISIGEGAFFDCHNLSSITLSNSITNIGTYAFMNCNLSTITIPSSVTNIGSYAFYDCGNLTSITVASENTVYDSRNFCKAIIKTSTNTLILGCRNTSIPNTVTTIGPHAFRNCTGLTSISIPNSVISIDDYAFCGCTGLSIVTIPNTVTSMGSNIFQGCTGLSSVIIPNLITVIGNNTFAGCSSLTSITLPNTIVSIGSSCFSGCTNLTTIELPENITSIENSTFYGCSGLNSITIPDAVTQIKANAFQGCNGLTEITSLATVAPLLGNNAFYGVATSININIPCGSLSSYSTRWSYFSNFSEAFEFSLNAQSFDNSMGTATVTTQPTCQSPTAEIYAIANNGYRFSNWSTGSISNPDYIYLTSDTTITAYFILDQYEIVVQSDDESMGAVSGGGVYNNHETITITAHPTAHYHFVRWSDGNTDNPRQYVVTGDATLTAFFAIDTHSVSVVSNDIARGMVNSTGTEFVYGTPCTVTATAYTGFEFIRWSNGVTANPYTFAVLDDIELTAIFEEEREIFTVTVVSANPAMGDVFGGGSYPQGETITISASPHNGYHFERWSDNNTQNPRNITVNSNITLTAYFAANAGIDDIDDAGIIVYAKDYQIHIDEAIGKEITVYTIDGRAIATLPKATEHVAITVTNTGVYIVKIGDHPARKVVVIR